MKILLVNTYDRGGAANSGKRLHLGLLSQSINSKVLLKQKGNNWPEAFKFLNNITFIKPSLPIRFVKKVKRVLLKKGYKFLDKSEKQKKFLRERSRALEMFSFPNSDIDITTSDFYKDVDIINLHWVANFLDYTSFFPKNNKPVVWTLHDMNPFSGGEHYEEELLGIDDQGFPFLRKYSDEEIKIQRTNLQIKKDALSQVKDLTIVAPSKWLMEEAKKSEVFTGFPVHHIPYGLDPIIYSKHDKYFSRDVLNIPRNKKVILFVADFVENHRKGFAYLERAIKQIANKDLVLCSVGNKEITLGSSNNLIDLGPIVDERLMAIAYSAADVFVIPSLMDNMPNTVLESLMCGTPVIGFPIGGIKEMIQPGENGLLTREISVNSLVETIETFLNLEQEFDGNLIRENAIKKYDQKVQANSYISLFRELLGKP